MKNSNIFRDRMTRGNWIRSWLLASFASFCLINIAYALDPNRAISQYVHDTWGTDQGFLGGSVYAINQSSDGYLWIGTERGLVRFDGFKFTLIQYPLPGLPAIGPVRGLVSDAEGDLWIRLDGPQLLIYRDGKFEDASIRLNVPEMSFTAMSVDNEGGALISGLLNRTFQYHGGRFTAVANGAEVPGTVISLAETRDHRIWMGTSDDGLFQVRDGHISNISAKHPDLKINTLLPTSNGGLWIGTDHGMIFWNGAELASTGLPASFDRLQILTMIKDHDRNLWVGTDHGLIRITPSRDTSFAQINQSSVPQVSAIFEDRDGDLWFGGPRGIQRLRDGMFTTYTTDQGVPADTNGPVYVDSDGLTWFGPRSGGLYWLKDGRVGSITVSGLDRDVVYSIDGGKGEVWIGRQHGGLTTLTKNGKTVDGRTLTRVEGLPQNSVYSVRRCRDGTVWAASVSAGVSRLMGGMLKNYSVANGLTSNSVNSIVEGFDGTMWFGTPNGLDSFSNGRWTNRLVADGLPSSNVTTIFEDSKHVLWIATTGGLAFLASGHIGLPHNLPEYLHEQIFGIAEDNAGSLWISTSDHVLQVDRDRLIGGSLDQADVRSYGVRDGLLGDAGIQRDRSIVADAFGRLWLSLDHGLAVADTKVTLTNSGPVAVRIESILVGGSQISLKESPKISLSGQSITFSFASSNLSVPERIRFRYKLENSDRTWSPEVSYRQVTYTNLRPGSYRFSVVASNSAGQWNGPETTFQFVIEPALWQTWWFRISFIAVCTLTSLLFYRLRMHRVAQRWDRLLQERLGERTRIAQELHDTLLQSFQGLMFRFQTIEEMLPNRPNDAKKALEGALDLADQALMESRDAIKDIRSSPGASRDLAKALDALIEDVKGEVDSSTQVVPEIDVIVIGRPQTVRPVLRAEILRIAREAIRNALRHAKAGRIETEITYDGTVFRLHIRDDGTGIDPAILERRRRAGHWGLVGMEERAKRVGGGLDVWSKIGAGTEVELRIPAHIAYSAPNARGLLTIFRRKAHQDYEQ